MGIQYILVNLDKQEKVAFYDLDCGTKHHEIVSNPVATAIISHYLITNSGDKIAFIDDTHFDFDLFGKIYPADDLHRFEDKTNVAIDELIAKNIFKDNGKLLIDKDDSLYVRDIVLINP